MRKIIIISFAAVLFFAAGAADVKAAWDAGISVSSSGEASFYFSIGDYYKVPEAEVKKVKSKKISDEEMAVVFFLASRAKASSDEIIKMRLAGKSWIEITIHYGLSPDIYNVKLKEEPKGPPYGKAYGYYKNKSKGGSSEAKLSDDDVVNLVNLRFLSEYHGYSADDVIKMRSGGKSFSDIDAEIKKGKGHDHGSHANHGDHGGKGRGNHGKGKK